MKREALASLDEPKAKAKAKAKGKAKAKTRVKKSAGAVESA